MSILTFLTTFLCVISFHLLQVTQVEQGQNTLPCFLLVSQTNSLWWEKSLKDDLIDNNWWYTLNISFSFIGDLGGVFIMSKHQLNHDITQHIIYLSWVWYSAHQYRHRKLNASNVLTINDFISKIVFWEQQQQQQQQQ